MTPKSSGVRDFVTAQGHSGITIEVVGSVGICCLVLAGCLKLPGRLQRLLRSVAAVGTLALTMYLLHFILAIALLPGPLGQIIAFATVTVILMLVSVLILRRFRQGPLEWVVGTFARRLRRA